MKTATFLAVAAAAARQALAIDVNVNQPGSVQSAGKTIGSNLMAYSPQDGRWTQLEDYQWWISGGAWGAYTNYAAFTNDTEWVNATQSAIAANVGSKWDFDLSSTMVSEQNDDQAFWVFTAMEAMELDLAPIQSPIEGINPYMLAAQNAFNDFVGRWNQNSTTCGGGMAWGFHPNPGGGDPLRQLFYKNSVTNGGFFLIASRLARYTGEEAYAQAATTIWDWMQSSGLMASDYSIFDGAGTQDNCKTIDKTEWTYNSALFVYGAAAMADYYDGKNQTWTTRAEGLVDAAIKKFTKNGVLYESSCETQGSCDTDQKTFKAYLARYLGRTASVLPSRTSQITTVLQSTAKGVASSCTGGDSGSSCGDTWLTGTFSGNSSMMFDFAAFEAMTALMGIDVPPKKA